MRRKERVEAGERQKLAFIAEYYDLCKKHGMFVIQIHDADEPVGKYAPWCVAVTREDPSVLDAQIEEMKLEDARWVRF